jgi:hypothetical protein
MEDKKMKKWLIFFAMLALPLQLILAEGYGGDLTNTCPNQGYPTGWQSLPACCSHQWDEHLTECMGYQDPDDRAACINDANSINTSCITDGMIKLYFRGRPFFDSGDSSVPTAYEFKFSVNDPTENDVITILNGTGGNDRVDHLVVHLNNVEIISEGEIDETTEWYSQGVSLEEGQNKLKVESDSTGFVTAWVTDDDIIP